MPSDMLRRLEREGANVIPFPSRHREWPAVKRNQAASRSVVLWCAAFGALFWLLGWLAKL